MGECRPIKISNPPKVSVAVSGNVRKAVEGAVAKNAPLARHLRKQGLKLDNAEIRVQRRGRKLSVNILFKATGAYICMPSDVIRAVKKALPRRTRALIVPAKTQAKPKPAPRPTPSLGGLGIGDYHPSTTLRIQPKTSRTIKLSYKPGAVNRNSLGNRLARLCQTLTRGYKGYKISFVFTKAEFGTNGIKSMSVSYHGTRKPPTSVKVIRARIQKYLKSKAFQAKLKSEQDYGFVYPQAGLARLAQR